MKNTLTEEEKEGLTLCIIADEFIRQGRQEGLHEGRLEGLREGRLEILV